MQGFHLLRRIATYTSGRLRPFAVPRNEESRRVLRLRRLFQDVGVLPGRNVPYVGCCVKASPRSSRFLVHREEIDQRNRISHAVRHVQRSNRCRLHVEPVPEGPASDKVAPSRDLLLESCRGCLFDIDRTKYQRIAQVSQCACRSLTLIVSFLHGQPPTIPSRCSSCSRRVRDSMRRMANSSPLGR